jgi:carbon monoxide dehydrogenase subunit G
LTDTTWYEFRTVGPEFADTASTRYVVVQDVAAPRQAVWDAFADPASWSQWFPYVEWVTYDGPPPYGVGTIRKSMVAGCAHDEKMVVWDEPNRWGYIINRATQPIAAAQIEITEFEDIPGGTRVRWILGCEPLGGLTFLSGNESFETFLGKIFADAMRRLEVYIGKKA